MTWQGAMGASLLAALGRPSWWLLALASFLLRGGFVVLILPIVSLPTAAGLANITAPAIVGLVFGGPPSVAALIVGIAVAGLVWLVVGGFVAAAVDVELFNEVASDEELDDALVSRPGLAARVRLALRGLVARLLAHVPTLVVLGWAAVRLVVATYEELAAPGNAAIPIALRILGRSPEVVIALVVAWTLGESVGGLALRGLVAGRGLVGALRDGWAAIVRRPSTLGTTIATDASLVAVIAVGAYVAALTWSDLRIVIVDGGTRSELLIALFLFSASWLAAGWLIGIVAAWRQAAWTFEVLRRRRT